jgi:hypothetical protein
LAHRARSEPLARSIAIANARGPRWTPGASPTADRRSFRARPSRADSRRVARPYRATLSRELSATPARAIGRRAPTPFRRVDASAARLAETLNVYAKFAKLSKKKLTKSV